MRPMYALAFHTCTHTLCTHPGGATAQTAPLLSYKKPSLIKEPAYIMNTAAVYSTWLHFSLLRHSRASRTFALCVCDFVPCLLRTASLCSRQETVSFHLKKFRTASLCSRQETNSFHLEKLCKQMGSSYAANSVRISK